MAASSQAPQLAASSKKGLQSVALLPNHTSVTDESVHARRRIRAPHIMARPPGCQAEAAVPLESDSPQYRATGTPPVETVACSKAESCELHIGTVASYEEANLPADDVAGPPPWPPGYSCRSSNP
jgi:hypothetical protein